MRGVYLVKLVGEEVITYDAGNYLFLGDPGIPVGRAHSQPAFVVEHVYLAVVPGQRGMLMTPRPRAYPDNRLRGRSQYCEAAELAEGKQHIAFLGIGNRFGFRRI